MVPTLRSVLADCREAGIQAVYLEQTNRPGRADAGCMRKTTPEILEGAARSPGEQTQVYDGLNPEEGDGVIEKHQHDGFFETELGTVLASQGISTVVITDVATHICRDLTTRGAFFRGYDIVALEDRNAAFDLPDRSWRDVSAETSNRVWTSIVSSNFGDILTAEEFRKEITA